MDTKNPKKKGPRLLAWALALWAGLIPVLPAYAQSLNWGVTGQTFYNAPLIHDVNAMKGNIAYVNNNLGAVVMKIPGNEVSSTNFGLPWNTPIVFAQYDPSSSTGRISVTRLLHMPNGTVLVEVATFSPQNGSVYKPDFEGTNPFWQFVPNANGNGNAPAGDFMNIQLAAFQTAVGLVMQHEQSNEGWIAVNTNQTHTWSTQHCHDLGLVCWFKQHVQVLSHPDWIMAVPTGVGSGTTSGFLLPMLNSLGNGETTSQGYASPGGVSLRKTAFTLGVPSQASVNGQTVGALKVQAGVTFIDQGVGNNLPHQSFQSFYATHDTSGGLTGLGMLIVVAIVSAVTAGAGAAVMASMAPTALGTLSSAIGMSATLTSGVAAGFAGAAAALGNFIGDTINSGSNIGAAMTSRQTGIIGGNCANNPSACADTPNMSAYNLTVPIQQLQSATLQQGTAGATQPLASSKWSDPTPSISTSVTAPVGSAQGGYQAGYDTTKLTPGMATHTQTPLSLLQGSGG